MTHGGGSGEASVEYTAMLLGATGNVGGSIYHSIHKSDLARAMVAQSEQAFAALARGKGPAPPG